MPEQDAAMLGMPVGGVRRLTSGFIMLFLLIQLLVPLRYYLGGVVVQRIWLLRRQP